MQNKDKNGIICDICKTEYNKDFIYYSFDFRKIRVDTYRPEIRSMLCERIVKSLDYCENCCEKVKDTILLYYKPTGTYCELTGKELSGKYNLYYCTVDMIIVQNKSVKVDKRHFEFGICEDVFNKLAASEQRNQSNWSTE